ncbi:hypothetical protein [uncultured Tessaracoccus sp.]|uniref:hypothetical protein n=1 Tax=uncultured Tessaracoccus sp. TaxID=905023 RepID=UPI002621D16F|nr:hypothetical protein [uncultured Tessaracoccus sp.]
MNPETITAVLIGLETATAEPGLELPAVATMTYDFPLHMSGEPVRRPYATACLFTEEELAHTPLILEAEIEPGLYRLAEYMRLKLSLKEARTLIEQVGADAVWDVDPINENYAYVYLTVAADAVRKADREEELLAA